MTVDIQKLGQAIKRLQHRHHLTFDAKLAPLGITLVQWDALRAISQYPDASGHKLAQLTFQTDQSFGALATRMQAQGLIERMTGAGRAIRHRLTPTGERLFQEGNPIVNAVLSESFAPLSSPELETLSDLLVRLLE